MREELDVRGLSALLGEISKGQSWDFLTDVGLLLLDLMHTGGAVPRLCGTGCWASEVWRCARSLGEPLFRERQPLRQVTDRCAEMVQALMWELARTGGELRRRACGLWDGLLQRMLDQEYISDFVTPDALAAMMARMLMPQPGSRVLDPACGSGRVLRAVGRQCQKCVLQGIELNLSVAAAAAVRLRLAGELVAEVKCGDFFQLASLTQTRRDWDIVVSNPPYGGRLEDTIRFIDSFVQLLRPGGRCAVLVPEGFLNNIVLSRAVEARRSLLEGHTVEAVISLPAEIYQPRITASHSSLLIVRRGGRERRPDVFLGRIAHCDRTKDGAIGPTCLSDIDRVVRAWLEWCGGGPIPEADREDMLCWTVPREAMEKHAGCVLSAEEYRPAQHHALHVRTAGALEQVEQEQLRLEEMLWKYVEEMEQAAG